VILWCCIAECMPCTTGAWLLQVLRSRVVVSQGSATVATGQSILPVQQAVLPFESATLAAAYVACISGQEENILSVIAGKQACLQN
jgi:hypothetical protein